MQTVKEERGSEFFSEWVDDDERKMSQLLGIKGIENKRAIEAVKKYLLYAWRANKFDKTK